MTTKQGAKTMPRILEWETIARSVMDPKAVSILEVLCDAKGPLSPKDIADTLELSLGVVSYHVRMLRDRELVILVDTTPRRGALQHFYAPSATATRMVRRAQVRAA
jgi:DNA-binding transcriptional ArsR family regulator